MQNRDNPDEIRIVDQPGIARTCPDRGVAFSHLFVQTTTFLWRTIVQMYLSACHIKLIKLWQTAKQTDTALTNEQTTVINLFSSSIYGGKYKISSLRSSKELISKSFSLKMKCSSV